MELQKPSPILVADRFPRLLETLLGLLASTKDDDWQRPTAVVDWSVKDVAAHLLGDDIGLLSGRRDAFHGARVQLDSWEALVAWLNERNAQWVEASRRMSPRVLRGLLAFTGQQVSEYLARLDPFAEGVPVSWAGPEPAPVWLDTAREFTERWHHQQHIREALGQPGLMVPYFLGPVLATFAFGLQRAYGQVDAPAGTCVTLLITGAAGGSWTVRREGQGWQLFTGRPEDPQAMVILPEDTAWRLYTKGISKEAAREQARLEGDPHLAGRMLETVSIIA